MGVARDAEADAGGQALLYFDARDPTTPGATAINNALDAIDAALAPAGSDLNLGRQTLAGAVHDCKIVGVPVRDTGGLLSVRPIGIRRRLPQEAPSPTASPARALKDTPTIADLGVTKRTIPGAPGWPGFVDTVIQNEPLTEPSV